MRSTLRRCRRRIGTMCTSSGSISLRRVAISALPFPLDLGVAPAQVHRAAPRRRAELLAFDSARSRARRAPTSSATRARARRARRRLERREHSEKRSDAVAAQQRLLAARLELGDQLVGRAELVLRLALHAAGHRPVDRPVDLVAARVDRRRRRAVRVPQRVRERDPGSGPGSPGCAAPARAPSRW